MAYKWVNPITGQPDYYVSGGSDFTGNITVTKADPEVKLIDSGNSEYTRITKSDTNNKAVRYNRVFRPAGAGNALSFDGNNDYAYIDPTGLPTTSLTISVWFKKASDMGSSYRRAIAYGTAGNLNMIWLGYYDGDIRVQVYNGGSQSSTSTGEWEHLAIVVEADEWLLYHNGSYIGKVTETLALTNGYLWLGDTPHNPGAEIYKGGIDNLEIWDRELTLEEIQTIYNSGAAAYSNTSASPWDDSLVGLWRCDEGSGVTAEDSVGSRDATLENGTAWTTGKVPTASTIIEAEVWSSEDGDNEGEEGIQTFGDANGRTIISGTTAYQVATIMSSVGIGTASLLSSVKCFVGGNVRVAGSYLGVYTSNVASTGTATILAVGANSASSAGFLTFLFANGTSAFVPYFAAAST